MLTHTDLKKGVKIILEKEPYEVLSSSVMKKAQRRVVIQTKVKNLITGNVFERNFHQGDVFEEAEIEKLEIKFLYSHTRASREDERSSSSRDKFIFCQKDNPGQRFQLAKEQIGQKAEFLKPNQLVEAMIFNQEIVGVSLPIKVSLKVIEAPPGIKGNRSEAGMKLVVLESGAQLNVPLFIKEGDVIEVNTEAGEYVRRLEN